MKECSSGAAALAVLALLAVGCARPLPPPGGDVAEQPPQVVSTTPVAGAVVDGWRGPVVVRFDNRLSERGLEQAILVSPESGEVRVRRGDRGRELRISVEDGWLPGEIYRVEVRDGIQDLFGNVLDRPVELFFSTGPDLPTTAVAGIVTDRLTGRPVRDARVEAVREPDSVRYVAMSDTSGFFALRHVPPGRYQVRAFEDRNRNRRLDPVEPRDTAMTELAAADTALFAFRLLVPDTTPARLVRTEARDSMQVRLSFDDPLDPERPLRDVHVQLRQLPDSLEVTVDTLFFPHEWDAQLAAEEEAREEARRAEEEERRAQEEERDAAEPDTLPPPRPGAEPPTGPDTVPVAEAPGEPVGPAGPRTPPQADRSRGPDGELLPVRELVLVPARPLRPGVQYVVEVRGIVNIHEIPGGGGEAVFEAPQAREPPEPARDPGR